MIERKVFTLFACSLCEDQEQIDGTVEADHFEVNHKQCEILYEALLQYMHLGPACKVSLDQHLQRIKSAAYKKYRESDGVGVIEVNYDKFYR